MRVPAHARSHRRTRPPHTSWPLGPDSWKLEVAVLAAAVVMLIVATAGGMTLRAAPSASRAGAHQPAASPLQVAAEMRAADRLPRAARHRAAGRGHARRATGHTAGGPANANCTLIVPASPLTARGLATPYRLTATTPAAGPCHEANPAQAAFVQGAIIDPATGKISLYNPLVADAGSRPAVTPALPVLPARAVVALWFGFNGNVLTLRGSGFRSGRALAASRCVNGVPTGPSLSLFGQMAYCNASAFFAAANRAIQRHLLTVPPPGTGTDGLPCLTTRSFGLVDQDQSDNVTSQYLVTTQGGLAQDTVANRLLLAGATVLANGSDNGLVTIMDAALGCTPWLAPNLADGGTPAPALPLDELQAARYAGQGGSPVALVPLTDPMALIDGMASEVKTDAYRAGVDQPPLPAGESPAAYCRALEQTQGTRLQQDVNLLIGQVSPTPAAASNLFTFLANRLQQSFVNLGCAKFGLVNDVTITMSRNGEAVAACFRRQARPLTPGPGNPAAGHTVCPPMAAAVPSPSATAAIGSSSPAAPSSPGAHPSPSPSPAAPAAGHTSGPAPAAARSAPAGSAPGGSAPGGSVPVREGSAQRWR